jgi:hypothetical protein
MVRDDHNGTESRLAQHELECQPQVIIHFDEREKRQGCTVDQGLASR